MQSPSLIPGAVLGFGLLIAEPALAYVGPGVGLSAIGGLVALVFAVVLAILGFVWYPIKRLLSRRSRPPQPAPVTDDISTDTRS